MTQEPEQGSNPLDDPDALRLVQKLYLQARVMANELNDPEYVSDTSAADWQEYAIGLGQAFRGLDLLLIQGAPFPEEWVLGITTP
jgi:hypothetical protein